MNSDRNFTQTLADIGQGKASSFAFKHAVSVQYTSSFTDIESYNLVGKIEGGDARLKSEYGTKATSPGLDIVTLTKNWRNENYHKPSDEIGNSFDYAAARKYVQLNFLMSYAVAQTTTRPAWNTGDYFEVLGEKSCSAIKTVFNRGGAFIILFSRP